MINDIPINLLHSCHIIPLHDKLRFITLEFEYFIFRSESSEVSIEFGFKHIPENPLYQPGYRIEHAERNTSAEYGWWKTMAVTWIEWPGNCFHLN